MSERQGVEAKPFSTDEEVEHLVAAFRSHHLPRPHWTHHAHLTVGLWFLQNHTDTEALPLVRAGIRSYNEAVGVANTPTGGYHETLTRFYLWVVRQYLHETDAETPLFVLANGLIETYGDKQLPLQ